MDRSEKEQGKSSSSKSLEVTQKRQGRFLGEISPLVEVFFLWGLELDDLSGPFQPKPHYDSTKMPAELYGKSRGEKAFILHSLAEALFLPMK